MKAGPEKIEAMPDDFGAGIWQAWQVESFEVERAERRAARWRCAEDVDVTNTLLSTLNARERNWQRERAG